LVKGQWQAQRESGGWELGGLRHTTIDAQTNFTMGISFSLSSSDSSHRDKSQFSPYLYSEMPFPGGNLCEDLF